MAFEGALHRIREGWVGGALKSRTADSAFWLFVLIGITPALMSNLISPIEWIRLISTGTLAFAQVNDYARLAAVVLLAAGASIALVRRKYWHLLLLLPLALYAFSNNDASSPLYALSHGTYNVASALALFGFILSGSSRLRSLYFTAYLAALILVSLVEPLIWGYQIIIFLGFVVVARMAALFIRENINTFREMGLGRVVRVALFSLLMWAPILGFLLPGQILTSWLGATTEDFIYSIEPLSLLGKHRHENGEVLNPPRDFRVDINVALDIAAGIRQAELDAGLAQLSTFSEEQKGTIPDAATDIARQALPPDPLITMPNCHWYDLLCHIERAIKNGINRGYSGIRDRALADMHGELTGKANNANTTIQDIINDARQRVVGTVQSVKLSLQTAVTYALKTFDALGLILNLMLILAAIKSYLYVFARFAFRPGEQGIVTLSEPKTQTRQGRATFCKQNYTIGAGNRVNWFYSTRFEIEGRPGKFAIPQWNSAVLSRLLNWNYFMNVAKFDGRRGEEGDNNRGEVRFKTAGEMNLVEWVFHGNEEIIFHLDDFVAMTEGVTLSTIVSFRLSTLLLGRIIFHRAQGPGTILLRVRGVPTIAGSGGDSLNRPARLHVAWNRRTEFDVFAERDIINIYMRGVNLKSRPSDLVIVEAGDGNARARGGIARFIKAFLLPV